MRTIGELEVRLSEERIWRVRECSSIAALASRSASNTVEREIYLRSAAVLFYSHWEGFVKRSGTYYLRFLSYQRVPIDEMSPFLLRLFMRQQAATAVASGAWEAVAEKLLSNPQLRPKIVYKNQVETESNLSSRVFRQVCSTLGMSVVHFETKLVKIDDPLLKNRNAVAHGDKSPDLTIDLIEEMKDLVISLITLFRDEIENAAVTQAYRVKRGEPAE